MGKRNLTDRVLVITGASSGIGAETAVEAAKAGMNVALGARREDRLEQVAQRVRDLGRRAIVVRCDVRRDEDVQGLVQRAQDELGGVYAAFANAGYGIERPVLSTSDEAMRDIFETNYFGTLRLIHQAVPAIRRSAGTDPAQGRTQAGKGHLLICTSSVSEVAIPTLGAYCATKAAQDAVAGSLRAELALEGIDVSSVHPVGTASEFFDQIKQENKGFSLTQHNTPWLFRQTSVKVARAVVACLRRPRAEVWPMGLARLAMGFSTMFPGLTAANMRAMARDARKRGVDLG